MARPLLNWREWLEELQIYNSPDGDRARQILRLFDELESIGESYMSVFGALERQGHADTDDDDFNVVERVELLAARDLAIRALAEKAGLLECGDTTTELAPRLAMFLPFEIDDRQPIVPAPRCSECGLPQQDTPSGMTCINGHGGAPPLD